MTEQAADSGAVPDERWTTPSRRRLGTEVVIVFAISLGYSGLLAFVNFLYVVTKTRDLSEVSTGPIVGSRSDRPWFDLVYQLLAFGRGIVPVLLVLYLLVIGGESIKRVLGLDLTQPRRDLGRGAVLAAVIGFSGLALYFVARLLDLNLTLVATNLPDIWWRLPVLVLAALQNGLLEEVLVAGYLTHRLGQLGWSPWAAVFTSAAVRGSYHLYQGLGGFAGNFVMGVIFARLYQRWGRVTPLIIAHTLIDAVAFIGYLLLKDHVGWL